MGRVAKVTKKLPPIKRTIRGLPYGARLKVIDNSGAKTIQLFAVIGYKPSRRRYPQATIGDMIVASVKTGTPEMRKKVVRAIIVQMRQKFKRPNGLTVHFEENAAVIVDKDGNPKGTEIKGPVAREAIERWPGLARVAKMVV